MLITRIRGKYQIVAENKVLVITNPTFKVTFHISSNFQIKQMGSSANNILCGMGKFGG